MALLREAAAFCDWGLLKVRLKFINVTLSLKLSRF